MNYRYLIANSNSCIPINSIEDQFQVQRNRMGIVEFEVISEVTISFQNYHSECHNFPNGKIWIYSIDNQKVEEGHFTLKNIELDNLGWIHASGQLKRLGDTINEIPNNLIEYIRDEKLKSIGII